MNTVRIFITLITENNWFKNFIVFKTKIEE